MRLSELAYLAVKRAVGDMGKTMSYEAFCKGEAATDTYLSNSVDRVFSDINAFFGRLVQLERIPARIEGFGLSAKSEDGLYVPFSSLAFRPNVIKAAFQFTDTGDYVNLEWSVFQNGVRIKSLAYDDGRETYVQYRLSMPSFGYSDVVGLEEDAEGNVIDNNIDLYEKYGIMEEAMPLCIDYVDSLQNRDSDASLANNLMIQTESRISGLSTHETLYLPKSVRRKVRI